MNLDEQRAQAVRAAAEVVAALAQRMEAQSLSPNRLSELTLQLAVQFEVYIARGIR